MAHSDATADAGVAAAADAAVRAAARLPAVDVALRGMDLAAVLTPNTDATPLAHAAHGVEATGPTREAVVVHVLHTYIRPRFAQAAAYARVQDNGRAAHGAPAPAWEDAVPAWDDGQAPNVLAWCVRTLTRGDRDAWERVWPLVVPAVMVLLDAPGARPKLLGACVVCEMLDLDAPAHAPAPLLQRTGLAALLDDALSNALHHMTDAEHGAVLLSAALRARRALAHVMYPDAHASSDAFEAHARLFSEGVLAALSYCAAPSASAPAQPAPPGPALGSARLQQALAATAAVWTGVLCADLGTPALRFWNAYMDWATTWLEHAFSACTALHTAPPRRTLTSIVDTIAARSGTAEAEAAHPAAAASSGAAADGGAGADEGTAPDWAEATHVLLASIERSIRGMHAMLALAIDADAEQRRQRTLSVPAALPDAARWADALLCAAARCYVQLSELETSQETTSKAAALIDALRALCASLRAVAPAALQPSWDALHRSDAVRPLLST